MINFDESSKINSNKISNLTMELIYENINLMDENIRLILENRKLMKRVERAMEFDELVKKISDAKDVAYWKQKNMELEDVLKKVVHFCPSGYKNEIWKVLK